MTSAPRVLRVRWLGRVPYGEAHALQRALWERSSDDHLLLLEHPHVYTLGVRADLRHVLVPPAEVGADLVRADRGGDVTYHGPGQLVGYPVLAIPGKGAGAKPDTVAYVRRVEQVVIDALDELGVRAGRLARHPGVWVDAEGGDPRKICAIGVRLSRGRSMHGFALNVEPDMTYFDHIVPCGIDDKRVTSLAREGVSASMSEVVDVVSRHAVAAWARGEVEVQHVAFAHTPADLSPFSRGAGAGAPVRLQGRLAAAGVTEGLTISARKPEWLRARVRHGPEVLGLKRTMRDLGLVTVCEEAGCPNVSECWSAGTATFMIGGDRCTRACGFCLVDTRKPEPLDPGEPEMVAEAVARMGLRYAVITAVARDDVADGGAGHFAATVTAIRRRTPGVQVEVLIPDLKGDAGALAVVLAARPDVLNHNVETVPRLQRAVRPSAGYARSLALLARATEAGFVTKSGLIVGMGETTAEVLGTLADLRGVGVDIVTIGQYLRPTTNHLPVSRWYAPAELDELRAAGEAMGIAHVEAAPLTRSSHHAQEAAAAAGVRLAARAVNA